MYRFILTRVSVLLLAVAVSGCPRVISIPADRIGVYWKTELRSNPAGCATPTDLTGGLLDEEVFHAGSWFGAFNTGDCPTTDHTSIVTRLDFKLSYPDIGLLRTLVESDEFMAAELMIDGTRMLANDPRFLLQATPLTISWDAGEHQVSATRSTLWFQEDVDVALSQTQFVRAGTTAFDVTEIVKRWGRGELPELGIQIAPTALDVTQNVSFTLPAGNIL